ncbi:Uncharacterised protein [Mycobacteroides abscessus subsp. abscessus]|nr:Uncharacterised protein [Mycobacteroides abscessus subsp. abscessus]SIK19171.1 Uncharacterised protein [Mycobacteroides abscessus subsp. abscessus]
MAVRRLPGSGAPFTGAQRHGSGSMAGFARCHRGLDGAHSGRAVAGRGAGGRATADFRWRGVPTRPGRTAGHRRGRCHTRGLEHLRAYRGDRGGMRGQARRSESRQHRIAAARLGSGGRGPSRQPGRLRRGRRTGHRRYRPGQVPGPRKGCRKVRSARYFGLVESLPKRRSGPLGTGRVVLPGPRRRPGESRWPPHRTGRGGCRAGQPARCERRCGRGAQDRQRHPVAGRLYRQRGSELRYRRSPREPGRVASGRAGTATGQTR